MKRVKRGGSAVNRSECGNDLPSNFSRSFFQLSLNYVYLGSFRRGGGGAGWWRNQILKKLLGYEF